ncbi:hypothetical protein RB195_012246 [Necator americanus]|uniref:Uncharacterized protein n=1 Tax=Necator americanus TaxID=51031 RepID=A0ABR1D6B5_NECAM
MKVILLISLLLVVDVFSLNKTWTTDNFDTGVEGNETKEEARKSVGMKEHKLNPFVLAGISAGIRGLVGGVFDFFRKKKEGS